MPSGSVVATCSINPFLNMLSRQDIEALWALGGEFREVAAQEIVVQFERCYDLFFDYLAQPRGASLLRMPALARFPFLGEGFAPPEPFDPSRKYALFEGLHAAQHLFFDCFDRWAEAHRDLALKLWPRLRVEFPGIRADLERRHPKFRESEPLPPNPPLRQLMVFVTGWCNLHCPYCFSNDIARREISEEDLERIFRWAKREGVESITPCGGEPLMYRFLPRFLAAVRESGMTTYFASNFTIDCSGLADFRPEVVRAVYLHLTDESLQNPRLRGAMMRNIELAKERKIELVARANITSTDSKSFEPWFEFLHQTGIPRLHVALTIPSLKATNAYVDLSRFEAYVPLIEGLVARADAERIALGFAKPLPLCLFSTGVAERLLQEGYGASLCNIYEDDYMHNICLSPEMNFAPCLGLSAPKIAFDEELSWGQIGEKFRPEVEHLLQAPLREVCADCYLYARRLCQGACLSYKSAKNHE